MTKIAEQIFIATMDWLQENYRLFRFYTERDVVWTVQKHLINQIETKQLNLQVFNDYPIPLKLKRGRADLVVISDRNLVQMALEFKYEPSHHRRDILNSKFPVVFWNEVIKDVERIASFVESGNAEVAYSLLIDEGGHFRYREAPPGCKWSNFPRSTDPNDQISILLSRAERERGKVTRYYDEQSSK